MPQSEYSFVGAMDDSSPDQKIDRRYHRSARNGYFKGRQGFMRWESAFGTTQITNPFLPNSGTNLCICLWYDQVKQRFFDFNFNSSGTHGIYVYNTVLKTWATLIQTGTNTQGDPLGFTATTRIQRPAIIYGDNNSGDLLFYVDSLQRPTKINIDRFLGNIPGLYNPIKRAFLNVIKAPPIVPPKVTYENDGNVKANNLLNSLFQFAYTYIYDDNEESVLSSGSIVPLPVNQFSNVNNSPTSNDARISVYLRTGDANVKKIRLYMRQTQNGITSNWFIADTIIKANLGIIDNSVYRYLFYNNGNYPPADVNFTTLLYDWVPQQAGNQALLNGNVISYGAITEGYPWFGSAFSYQLNGLGGGSRTSNGTASIPGFLFFAEPNGLFTGSQPQIQITVTGAGQNDVNGNPVTLTNEAEIFQVYATSNGSDISFNATVLNATTIAIILTTIKNAAVSAGWTFVSQSSNNLVIYYPTGTIVLKSYLATTSTFIFNNYYASVKYPQSSYSLGVVYWDANGKTNGVITDISANLSTLPYNFLLQVTYTQIQLNLGAITPPPWAVSYSIVETNTLTYSKYLNWISNQAFSNVGQLVVNQYAYIGISNIADYNAAIQSTQGVVGYEFTQGDRIRFIGHFDLQGNFNSNNKEYAILGLEVNPIINGTVQAGNFIKIQYPTADIDPVNFKFDGSPNFQNYLLEIFHVSSNAAPQTANTGITAANGNVYYEIGAKFGIGNPGTNMAFHFGNLGDNKVAIQDGDVYYRSRTIPAGTTTYIVVGSSGAGFSNRYVTPFINIVPITNSSYTIGPQNGLAADPFNYSAYPQYGDGGGLFVNTSGSTFQLRLRGTVEVAADHPTWMDIYAKIDNVGGGTGSTVTILQKSGPISTVAGTATDVTFDATFSVPNGAKVWLIFGNGDSVVNMHTQAFQMRVDVVRNITITCFDKSFSDVYNLITNSDNRPNLQDTTALTSYFSTLFRFSNPYLLGTNINNTNRFYPNNFDEFDKSLGDIMLMVSRQRELRVYQKRRCGRIGIFSKFVKNAAGAMELIVTDAIITQNNIQYYEGEFGIGNQPDALCSSGFADYFTDPIKAAFLRVSNDGVENITHELTQGSKVQAFAGANLPNYLKQYAYTWGGNSVILAAYNFTSDRDSEAIFCFQAGTSVNGNITGQSLAFVENGNRWTSFYDFAPDAIACAENVLYSAYNGVLYSHTNNTTYCNFYGTQFAPIINIVENNGALIKKTWTAISERSNVALDAPSIQTDQLSYGQVNQQSNLVASDFVLLENQFHASFYKDTNSIGGLINGDALKGTIMNIQLQPADGSKFIYLSAATIKYIISPVLEVSDGQRSESVNR